MGMKEEYAAGDASLPHKRFRMLGTNVLLFQEVTSTNTVAMQFARAGAPENTIVMSSRQNAGQGRLGRSWFCPAGQGLMMSLILKPEIEWQLVPQLTLLCGVAVAETVQRTTGLAAGIKWPNDVVLNGKKICGILAQSNYSASGPRYVVVGLGLNVNLDPWLLPADCRDTSTSLKREVGFKISRWQILKQFIIAWKEHYQKFIREGHPYLRQEWLENNVTLGRTVLINRGSEEGSRSSLQGLAVDISERGGLIIRFPDGREEEFMAEDLSLGKSHYGKGQSHS